MKIRVTDAPANLVRVQLGEHVRYIRRKGGNDRANGRLNNNRTDGTVQLFRAEKPAFEIGSYQIFVHAYADRTEVIVVKTILPGLNAAA